MRTVVAVNHVDARRSSSAADSRDGIVAHVCGGARDVGHHGGQAQGRIGRKLDGSADEDGSNKKLPLAARVLEAVPATWHSRGESVRGWGVPGGCHVAPRAVVGRGAYLSALE